jgi:MFS transporter, DHA1 family, inner membrane transport protein
VLLTTYGTEASLNLANALGAVGGSITLAAGLGTLSTAWVGVLLAVAALVLFAVTVPRLAPPQQVLSPAAA